MGNFWQTIQVKVIGEEKFDEYGKVSKHANYSFAIFVNAGKENLGE